MMKIKLKSLDEIKLQMYKTSHLYLIEMEPNKVKRFFKRIWFNITYIFRWAWQECRDWKFLLILLLTNAFFSSPIWICLPLGLITKNPVLTTIGTTWQLIYTLPCWFPLCIAVTIPIHRLVSKK